jgi:hypothetical protein
VTETGCENIKFRRVRSARRRLHVLDHSEIALEISKQRAFGAALQDFSKERAAGLEHLAREHRRRLGQRHDAQMVGLAMTGRIRRHVGEHDVDGTTGHGLEFFRRIGVEKIKMKKIDARQRRHVEKIDRDHAAGSRADPRGRHLAPTARRRAEIDHVRP